ncbi:MAG: phage capsid protein [Ruminococcus sp.]|nr:phage capsid protein [Ruminococcus sp.]
MISAEMVSSALKVQTINNSEMKESVQRWSDLYKNSASWNNGRVISLCLASAISREFSRLVLAENEISAIGDDYVSMQFEKLRPKLPVMVEQACAMGGIIIKPYLSNGRICVDAVLPVSFFAVNFSEDTVTAAVFPEQLVIGKNCYTRLEFHQFDPKKRVCIIRNQCYRSNSVDSLGSLCSLSEVPNWSGMQAVTVLENVDRPLFAYFKMPFANIIDYENPFGISVYENAVELIHQADAQWERILWEFESGERAIDATEDIFRYNQNGKPILPKGRERMFRTYDIQATEKPFIETFSPEIRDISLFNGLNRIFQRIEFNCGLAYGTLSDPQTVEKTAEEIRASKQRSYTQISSIQRNFEFTLENLLYIYNYYSRYFGLSKSDAVLSCV